MTDLCIVKSCLQTKLALTLQGCAVGRSHSAYIRGVILGCLVQRGESVTNVLTSAIEQQKVLLYEKVEAVLQRSTRMGVNFASDQWELKLLPRRTAQFTVSLVKFMYTKSLCCAFESKSTDFCR